MPSPETFEAVAARHSLPAVLVAAIVAVESNGNTWAWNPEPRYRYFWDVKRNAPFRALSAAERVSEKPPADFRGLAGDPDNEWWAQAASWGLMQVMGGVARERGYRGAYLSALCDSQAGLEYGCLQLAYLRRRYFAAWHWGGVIAAYNAGSPRLIGEEYENQRYVDKVRAQLGGALD